MDLELPDAAPDGWTVIAASGEVDVTTAPRLRDQLADLFEAGAHRLIVDLDRVSFIDSTGLGIIVGAVRRARAAAGEVRVVCTDSRLLRIFGVTGLDRVFPIYGSVDDAGADQPGRPDSSAQG